MNETRSFALEVRSADDGRTLEALIVPYGTLTTLTEGPEVFDKGAFRRSIAHMRQSKRWPKLHRSHDLSKPVGVASVLSDEDTGPRGTFRLADTALGNEARQEVAEKVLDGISVGFTTIRERFIDGVRHIQEARLNEVSLVSVPAYPDARVLSVRSMGSALELPPRPDIAEPRWITLNGVRWMV